MDGNRTDPVGGRPLPTRLLLVFGVPIGLGLASARIARDAATRSGASDLAGFLIPVGASALVAAASAAVMVWLVKRRR